MYAVSFSMWERVVGGFVMALIRYIHVKKQSWILSIGNSMTLTLAFSLHFLLLAIGVGHQLVSDLTIGTKLKNALCFGISFELFEMIQAHKGNSKLYLLLQKKSFLFNYRYLWSCNNHWKNYKNCWNNFANHFSHTWTSNLCNPVQRIEKQQWKIEEFIVEKATESSQQEKCHQLKKSNYVLFRRNSLFGLSLGCS